jgi:hypothetical protein
MPDSFDAEIRAAAFQAVERLVREHGPILPWSTIAQGFDELKQRQASG